MEPIKLRYGEKMVPLSLEGASSVEYLEEKRLPPIQNLDGAFLRAAEQEMIDSLPLNQLVAAGDLITIVISDITRFWMRQDKICRVLIQYLHDKIGIPYKNIVILVALGTHRPQTDEELRTLVSPDIYEKVKVVNHDCMAGNLCDAGTTSRGTRVFVNPLAVGRKTILIGGTVHHLMAGFGGGRKSIVPGIAGKQTILMNHLHSLSPDQPCSNPLIGMGLLEKNPIHEDMDEAAALVSPVFGINLVVNSQSQHCRIICGHWKSAWEESCRVVQDAMGVPIQRKADVVVVSCGGYPKDINLYQGVKSLLNAAQAVKDGGDIVFLAECREGGGAPAYFSWIESVRRGTLDADLRKAFTIAGYIFYASCEVMARCSVHMLTEIPPEIVDGMGMHVYQDIHDLMAHVDLRGKDVFIMPYGGNTVPFLCR